MQKEFYYSFEKRADTYLYLFLTLSVSATILYSKLINLQQCYVFCVVKCINTAFSEFWGRVELGLGLHTGSFWIFVFSVLSHLLFLCSQMR